MRGLAALAFIYEQQVCMPLMRQLDSIPLAGIEMGEVGVNHRGWFHDLQPIRNVVCPFANETRGIYMTEFSDDPERRQNSPI